jgi:hypothetical protein
MDQMEEPPAAREGPEPPEWFKGARWAYHHFQSNRDALMKAPVFVAVAAALIVGYLYGKTTSSEELSIAAQRISFLGDQVSAYKDRLQGATPDQAAKEVASLKASLEAANTKLQLVLPDNPRHLTSDQKRFIDDKSEGLKTLSPMFYIFSWSVGDSPEYAEDFSIAFQKNKIVTYGPITTVCDPDLHGILVGLRDVDHPSPDALAFVHFLEDMGLSVKTTFWTFPPPKVDFDLYICS